MSLRLTHCLIVAGGAVQAANAYNVALLNGGMGDAGSQLLHVDQSALVYNNLVPLGLCYLC